MNRDLAYYAHVRGQARRIYVCVALPDQPKSNGTDTIELIMRSTPTSTSDFLSHLKFLIMSLSEDTAGTQTILSQLYEG
jgi:hypothetical protein